MSLNTSYPKEVYEALDQLCKSRHCSKQQIIREILRKELLPRTEEKKKDPWSSHEVWK